MSRLFLWIDHTGSYDGNSGVQRVTRALTRELAEAGRDLAFVGWSWDEYSVVRARDEQLRTLARHDGPKHRPQPGAGTPLHLNGIDQDELAGAWLLVPEVTHRAPGGESLTAALIDYCRNNRMKVAFVFHDLIPLRVEGYEDVRPAHEEYVRQIARADLILPVSAHAGETLRTYYRETLGLPETELPEIREVPLGEGFAAGASRDIAPEPAGGPLHVMVLGTIEPRKNQTALLRAFNALCRRRPDLDLTMSLVGNMHHAVAEEIEALVRDNPRIRYRNYISDREVAGLYRDSHFSVFPSVEEGFGLPVVESLWFGRPVICANFGAMAESSGAGGCLRVDTRSEAALEAALEHLATDAEARRRLAEEARARPFRPWSGYAADIDRLLSEHVPFRRVFMLTELIVQQPFNTGIQRVVRCLGRALADLGVQVDYVRLDEAGALRPLTVAESNHLARWNGPSARADVPYDPPERGEWIILPEVLVPLPAADAALVKRLKLQGFKVAGIFYDLIPHKMRDNYPAEGLKHFVKYWELLAQCDAILGISRTVTEELREYYSSRIERLTPLDWRIRPVPLAGELPDRPRSHALRAPVPGRLKLLNVGTIEPRKNQFLLAEAVAEARRITGADIEVTFVGRGGAFPDLDAKMESLAAAHPWIRRLDHVDDQELDRLYVDADVGAFASYEEGFGLPVLESLWAARPCFCHDRGAIREVAEGGGCLMVDMQDPAAIRDGLVRLATEPGLLKRLGEEAVTREIRSWTGYARDLLWSLHDIAARPNEAVSAATFETPALHLSPRPLLSMCVTTYNRAGWLKHSLDRLLEQTRPYRDVIEVLVCDNASTDATPQVVAAAQAREPFAAHRNPANVGMLGNLGVTARHASGEYVWLLGDDDLLVPGVVEDVLEGLIDHPDAEMAYLNYAFTHFDKPEDVENPDQVIAAATPIAEGGPNRRVNRLREVALLNENLFTAIYCCVFRRRHAIAAYTQNTGGQPFSSLLTCVPSTVYTMNMLLDRPAYWIGKPSVVVNMNVSWREHVLLWHLERMPELYEWVERQGMWAPQLETFRLNHATSGVNGVRHLYFEAPDKVRDNFSIERFIRRCIHLDVFKRDLGPGLLSVYRDACSHGRVPPGGPSAEELAGRYGLRLDAPATAGAR